MVQKSHRSILFLFIYYFSYFYKDSIPSKYKAKHDITKESCFQMWLLQCFLKWLILKIIQTGPHTHTHTHT